MYLTETHEVLNWGSVFQLKITHMK